VGSPRPKPPSVCGLDIGSNTFTCAEISRGDESTEVEVVRDVSLVVRLSENLRPGGRLAPEAVARGLETLERLSRDFELRSKPLRAVGTEVLRSASDPQSFTAPAEEILGQPIEIVDGEAEALLVSRGAIIGIQAPGPYVVCDVGGQSTEVCRQDRAGAWRPLSVPTGVVGLTERHMVSDPPTPDELTALRADVRAALADVDLGEFDGRLIAVAGTATTLGMLALGLDTWERDRVHGLALDRDQVEDWLSRMVALDAEARTARYGVRPGRADVFPAGLCVLLEVLDRLGRDRFTVSANGLRIGAALTLLEET
jgi:exopolyphosphatase/guanosine-5'-triphosphate,3'-diphosphate pyrophosphatase